jgi:hypothetical protein
MRLCCLLPNVWASFVADSLSDMATPLSVCTMEEQWSVIRFCGLKVAQGQKSIEGFEHNMLTVSYLREMYTYEWIEKSRMGEQLWRMKQGQDACAHPLLTSLSKSIQWLWPIDKWLLLKWQLVCKLAMVLHMRLSMRGAHPSSAFHTVQKLQKLGFKVLEHPTYSPNRAPSDYYLFGALKNALRCNWFATDQPVQEAVHSWLRNTSKTFLSERINKPVARWNKCIKEQDDYIEKWCN